MSMKKMIYLSLIFITVIKSQPIPDEAFMLQYLLTPEDFLCDSNNTMICDATGLSCNSATGLCFPPCTDDTDCLDFGAGTGLNKCEEDGTCITDGTCATSEDECATILGFTCNAGTGECEQPIGCVSNDECSTPGLGYCDTTLGTGICRQELCQKTEDCISTGYVCQNPPGLCIESCKTNDICSVDGDGTLVTCGDSGLCELTGCTQDTDCTGFTNTCLNEGPGICITTCETTFDCEDLGVPGAVCQDAPGDLGYKTCFPEPPIEVVQCINDTDCSDAGLNLTTISCVVTPADIGFCLPSCQTSLDCPDLYLTTTKCQDGFCIPDILMPTACSDDDECDVDALCAPGIGYCLPKCSGDDDCVDDHLMCDIEGGFCYPGCTINQDCSDVPGTVCKEVPALGYKTCIIDGIIPEDCEKDADCGDGYKCNSFIEKCYPSCNDNDDCIALGLNNPCKSQTYGVSPLPKVTIKYCDITQALPPDDDQSDTTTTVVGEDDDDQSDDDDDETEDGDTAAMQVVSGAFTLVIMVIFKVW